MKNHYIDKKIVKSCSSMSKDTRKTTEFIKKPSGFVPKHLSFSSGFWIFVEFFDSSSSGLLLVFFPLPDSRRSDQ